MEEEVNQRVVSLSVNTSKMTAGVLVNTMKNFLVREHQALNQHAAERQAERALERLPAGTRRLLQLRATGLSLDEIAAMTGRTKGGVKSSISAARHELMKALDTK